MKVSVILSRSKYIRVLSIILCFLCFALSVKANESLITRGELVFNTIAGVGCAGCHGAFAEGDLGVGPYIRGASDGSVRAAIGGVGPMIAVKAVITEQEITAVAAYVNYLGATQVARTQVKKGRFLPDRFATQPGTNIQVVIKNAGFSAQTFHSDNVSISELRIPARSAKSFLWQAPNEEGEFSLYCTDCKIKGQFFTLDVNKSAKKFLAIPSKIDDSM